MKKNVGLIIVNILLIVSLIIMMVLYFDMRKNAKVNLESLLKAYDEKQELNIKVEELEKKLSDIDNVDSEIIENTITSTEPYIPDGMKVADPNDNFGIKASDMKLDHVAEKVKIEVIEESISNKSVEIIITDTNKDPYGWGANFKVEKKENDSWKELPFISDDIAWIEIGYIPNELNQIKQNLNIENYYGELEIGTYRIIKSVYDNGNYIDFSSNEFEIN